MSELMFRADSRVADADTALLTTDGGTQTIASYEIDMAKGNVVLGGVPATIAALDDKDLLDSADVVCYDLSGDAPVALTADGQTYMVALALFLVGNVPVVRGFFGAEAADAAEVAPTEAQIYAAMVAAGEATYLDTPGLVIARMKIQRTAVDTMVVTHTAAASTDALKIERARAGCFA